MRRIETTELKNWIAPYLTVTGNHPEINSNLRQENFLKYFRELTIPNIFDKYAIILNPYWVFDLPNEKIKKNEIKYSDIENYEPEFPEEEYRAVKWIDFYKYKNLEFDLTNVVKENVEWNRPFKQMNNEIWPGEGLIDLEILKNICKIIFQIYGDENIELYYIFMATKKWDSDEMFEGKLSELIPFLENSESERTPSLIYDIEQKWALTSDIDLPFSIIGGSEKLISRLVENHINEIYLIE